MLDAKFAEDVDHDLLGRISKGTSSREYYWLERWYNVFRFGDDSGALRYFYCNVIAPPVFDGSVLSYVDLDIDILVEKNFSYRVLDLEEFENNARLFCYPQEVREGAFQAMDDLISLIDARAYPFNANQINGY